VAAEPDRTATSRLIGETADGDAVALALTEPSGGNS
jgi:hypothetical protein